MGFQRAGSTRFVAGVFGGLVALVLFIAVALLVSAPVTNGNELPLSSLQALAGAGHVESAVIYEVDHRVAGAYLAAPGAGRVQYWAAYPSSDTETPGLVDRLGAGGATVSIDPQSGKAVVLFAATYLAPALAAACLVVLLVLLLRGGMPALRIGLRARSGATGERHSFAEVAGAAAAVEALGDVAGYLRHPSSWSQRSDFPRAVLLYGPPGCGKRLLAEALAGEAGAWFFAHSGADMAEALEDGRAAAGRDAFAWARAAAPAVVFIADLEAAAPAGGGGGRTLNHLLLEVAGLTPGDGVVVVGAAPSLDALDPAILRPGRFDRRIAVDPPDLEARAAILGRHARSQHVDPTVDVGDVARRTSGLAGADLVAMLEEAWDIASRDGRTVLSIDIDEAVQRLSAAGRFNGRPLAADERRRAAVHEAGHAIVASALGRGRFVQHLSILVHGRGLARIVTAPATRDVMSRSDLLAELTVLCAGLAAEELYFDEPSTGSEDDLGHATELAHAIVARYGMSTKLGRVRIDAAPAGAELTDELNREIRALIDDASAAATDRLQRCHDPLVDLVLQLERDEVVEGVQLGDILIRALEVEIAGIANAPSTGETLSKAPPAQATRGRRR